MNLNIFLKKCKEKFINRLFMEDFLELKQGKMAVFEYEKEFIRLSKYTKDLVSDEVGLCIRFEGGLNEELRVLLSTLELKDFVTLSSKAQRIKVAIDLSYFDLAD